MIHIYEIHILTFYLNIRNNLLNQYNPYVRNNFCLIHILLM